MPDQAADPIRVLAVDDNLNTLSVLSTLLELAGFKVRSATSGPIALAAYGDFRPHAVLLDLGMPEMDGFEVCRRIRHSPQSESVLIVIVTGYVQGELREKAIEVGANYYFVKPVEFTKLVELVSECAAGGSLS